MTATGRPRPGGRTARTREAVHAAVRELIGETGSEHILIADVAARSGVHAATIYRRWGRAELLVLDVAVDRLRAELPVPATGDLEADLLAYARLVADDLTRPGGMAFLRAVLAAGTVTGGLGAPGDPDGAVGPDGAIGPGAAGAPNPQAIMTRRLEDFQAMLDRAGPAAGGLTPFDVLDGILAPLYLRVLFGGADSIDDAYVRRLVAKLMRQTAAS